MSVENNSGRLLYDHDPAWAGEFEKMAAVYRAALGDLLLRVEHVGSTSVPGIRAKPILDIDLVIPDYDNFPRVVEALGRLGYFHNGNQGILHREAFRLENEFPRLAADAGANAAAETNEGVESNGGDAEENVAEAPRRWMAHHLYVCPEYSEELARHCLLRDFMRIDGESRAEYQAIKEGIEARANGDQRRYADIKEEEFGDFFERTLAKACEFFSKRARSPEK